MKVLALAFLLFLPDEIDTARTALSDAFAKCDRSAALRAGMTILKLNAEGSPEAFGEPWKPGYQLYLELEKEQKKWAREMAANELIRDADGRPVSRGDKDRFYAAQKQYYIVTPKVDALASALPRAMVQMSKLSNPAAVKGLTALLTSSSDWLPRAAAADALGRLDDPAALEALLGRARTEDQAAVKVALADALGLKAKSSEAARKVLMSWLENPFWQIRVAAIRGLARSGDKKLAAPPLIQSLRTANGRLRQEVNEALKALTGVNKHGDYAAWKEWWEKNEEELLGGTYQVKPFERADERGITSFYGLPFTSGRGLFIIDTSSSMTEVSDWKPETAENDKLEGDRKIDVAKFELRRIIRQIPDGTLFNVISVNFFVTLLGDKMVPATKATRENAMKYLKDLPIKPGTDLHAGLTRGLDFAGGLWNSPLREDSIDTIYFLSDGVATSGIVDRDRIVDRVLDSLRYKKVIIHCIAVDAPAQGKIVMKALAEGTGGNYVER
ncbi:MAG TPA: HEAT repeat domain-containing protein [Planctomycetota bacterium]|nr:HEAT repeat domain-containing protein [Planctomycetota bacterium]